MATDRATCWSVTWYPPTDSMEVEVSQREIEEYAKRQLPPGWQVIGQMEQCPKSLRYHFQAMLKTPQVRKSAVIRQMDKAHIEVARVKNALASYVQKDETRVASIESAQKVPSMYEYTDIIASQYVDDDCKAYIQRRMEVTEYKESFPDAYLRYIDSLVAADIKNGRRGAEFIAVNPQWRSAWKLFGPEIISRYSIKQNASVQEVLEEQEGEEDKALFEENGKCE